MTISGGVLLVLSDWRGTKWRQKGTKSMRLGFIATIRCNKVAGVISSPLWGDSRRPIFGLRPILYRTTSGLNLKNVWKNRFVGPTGSVGSARSRAETKGC